MSRPSLPTLPPGLSRLKSKSEHAPLATEIIAESVLKISQGIKKIQAGRLNSKALDILVAHASGLGQREVRLVLDALESLEEKYLRKKA